MTYQTTQADCGCQTTCCDRHLAPAQDAASSCCDPGPGATASCGCGSTPVEEALASVSQADLRHLEIEFLYLDLDVCTRCQQSEANLEEAIAEAAYILKAAGIEVVVQKIQVQSENEARQLGFVTSPTIRLNSQDIQLDFKENTCGSCSNLSGEETACRTWTYQGQEYTAPPKAMIIEAILKVVYGGEGVASRTSMKNGAVPENLKRFFAGKENQLAV